MIERLESRQLLTAGGIDPSFGVDGAVSFTGGQVLVMSDGRIVTVNRNFAYVDGKPQYTVDINRYFVNGSVDPSFRIKLDQTLGSLVLYEPVEEVPATLDTRDRLFTTVEGRIYCILPNGKFDKTFGASGVVNSPFTAHIDSLFVQRDGKLVIGGEQDAYRIEFGERTDRVAAAVCRITADGKRDLTFGPKGVRLMSDFVEDVHGFLNKRIVGTQQDSAGRLILHYIDGYYESDRFYVKEQNVLTFVRHNVDGTLDPSLAAVEGRTQFSNSAFHPYSDDGYPPQDPTFSGNTSPDQFLLDAGGRLVFMLNDVNPDDPARSGIKRINDDGSIDTSFGGGDGLADSFFTDNRRVTLDSLVTLATGKMLIAAHSPGPFEFDTREQFLIQLNENGSLDSSFGTSGVLSLGSTRQIDALTLNTDGSILSSETVPRSSPSEHTLRRLWPHEGPLATLRVRNITASTTRPQVLDVTYRDDGSINLASLDNRDLRITGPNGFFGYARFLSVIASSNDDGLITARYRFNAPGGAWDSADIGVFSVRLMRGQVADLHGNFAAGRTLGQFLVRVPGGVSTQGLRSFQSSANTGQERDVADALFDSQLL